MTLKFFTATGVAFGFEQSEFTVEHVRLDDIAAHLSQINRFGGAGKVPYTVLEHSLLVAELVAPPLRRAALLHDATEAYLGDVVAPLKVALPGYVHLERHFREVISAAFGVAPSTVEDDAALHKADGRAFAVESHLLGPPGLWEFLGSPRDHEAEELLKSIREQPIEVCRQRFAAALHTS